MSGTLWGFNADRPATTAGIAVNDTGHVVYSARITVGATASPQAIFVYRAGQGSQKLVAVGDAAPGSAGGTFASLSLAPGAGLLRLNSAGQVAFYGSIVNSPSPRGVFVGSLSDGVLPVARAGDSSPVCPGKSFTNFGERLSLNESGRVAFWAASACGPSSIEGLFVGDGRGAPAKVVAEGDPLGGGTVETLSSYPWLSNTGQVAYIARLSGPAPAGVFLGTAGGMQTAVAVVGQAVPGDTTTTYSDFRDSELEVNGTGQVAFWAALAGPGPRSGLFLGSPTATSARLLEGQSLPGGGKAGYISPAPMGSDTITGEMFALADTGEMSMYAPNVVDAPNLPRHIIAAPNGALRLFASNGDPATGTGSLFCRLIPGVATSSTGRFFFSAVLTGGPARWGVFCDGPPSP